MTELVLLLNGIDRYTAPGESIQAQVDARGSGWEEGASLWKGYLWIGVLESIETERIYDTMEECMTALNTLILSHEYKVVRRNDD